MAVKASVPFTRTRRTPPNRIPVVEALCVGCCACVRACMVVCFGAFLHFPHAVIMHPKSTDPFVMRTFHELLLCAILETMRQLGAGNGHACAYRPNDNNATSD
jgi:ferredoxin